MTHIGKHKIQNRWEDDEYVVVSQPNSDIPLYIVQQISGGKQKNSPQESAVTFRL